MPISLPNWAQHETKDYNGYGDLLENALKGYEMARKPKQIGQEEQYRELINKLTNEQGRKAGIEADYMPREKDMGLKLNQQKYDWNPERWKADIGLKGSQARHYDLANQLTEEFGAREKEADINAKINQSKYAHLMHLTPEERNAGAMIGYENLRTPEGQRLVAALNRIAPEDIGQGNKTTLPEGSRSMAHWPQASVAKEIDRQNAELDKIQTVKVMMSGIEDARKIMKAYPNMYRSLALIMADPDDEKKVTRIIGGLTDQREKTAAIQFRKITQSIVNRNAEALGSRGTNVRYKGLQQEKPSLFNTPQGNEYVLDKLEEEFKPQLEREQPLLDAYGTHSLPRKFNYSKKESPNLVGGENEITNAINRRPEAPGGSVAALSGKISAPTLTGYKTGIDKNGKQVDVDPDDEADFIEDGGRIL